MADNVELNLGSGGSTVATDDIGGVQYQRIKLHDSTADSATGLEIHTVDAAAGAAPTGLINLSVRNDTLASLVGTDGDYAPLQVSAVGALYVDGSGATQPISGTVTANAGTGTFTVDGSGVTQPISGTVTANAGTGTFTVTGDVTNAGTFAVQSTLQAGTAEIGKLAAGVAEIGNIKNSGTFAVQSTLQAGTAEIGKLAAGTAEIGNVKNAGTFAVQSTLQTGANAIGTLAANSGVDIGDVDVTSITAGANLVGDVGISGARTSGGTTLYKNIDVDESEDQVKGSAGQVFWVHAINLKATPLYLKFYNVAAASVTVGTTVPDLTFPVPSAGDTNGAGFTLAIPNGIAFSTAITIAGTTGVADNDSGAPGANELVVNLGYA